MLYFIIADVLKHKETQDIVKNTIPILLTILICVIPIIYQAATNPTFFNRLDDKNTGNQNLTFSAQVERIEANIPKYYGYDYLFLKGENGIPNTNVTRHSIAGLGILNPIILPLIVVGLVGLKSVKKNRLIFLAGLTGMILYPVADLLTTNLNSAPYSLSATMLLMALPLVIGYPIYVISKISRSNIRIVIISLILIYMGFYAVRFYNALNAYPVVSSDFWGYQQGMKEIIAVGSEKQSEYDEIIITEYFNQADSLFKFYNYYDQCSKCSIGGIDRFDPLKKQLFVIRSAELDEIIKEILTKNQLLHEVGLVKIATGNAEYTLLEISDKPE